VTFPLFELVPELAPAVPRVSLGEFPTPVESLAVVSRVLGVDSDDAWIKRDDLSSPVYGGNKVRTLEVLFGQARALGRRSVVASGAFGSNHALATALHAPRAGLEPGALLFPQPISLAAFENLRALVGTRTDLHALPHWSALPFGMSWLSWSRGRGSEVPYVMVPGGATPLGALGYVSAALELGRQIEQKQLPLPRRIVVGVGSTCTSAGLLVGLALAAHFRLGFEASTLPRLTSVRVSPWPVTSRVRILNLARRTARLLHELAPKTVPHFERSVLGARFEVDPRFLGPGYGEASREGEEALALWREAKLPPLDGTYSAKAAARVVASLRAREAGPILFWSTKSSAPLPPSVPLSTAAERALPYRIRTWLFRAERELG